NGNRPKREMRPTALLPRSARADRPGLHKARQSRCGPNSLPWLVLRAQTFPQHYSKLHVLDKQTGSAFAEKRFERKIEAQITPLQEFLVLGRTRKQFWPLEIPGLRDRGGIGQQQKSKF